MFYVLAGLSAAGLLLIKDVFKAALLLLVCLLSLSALYVFALAEFVAVTQILIYAGGVVVLIIFGIMLTSKMSGKALKVGNSYIFAALPGASVLFAILFITIRDSFIDIPLGRVYGNTIQATGVNLMSSYVLPFELSGIMLLIVLIGATVISTANQGKERE